MLPRLRLRPIPGAWLLIPLLGVELLFSPSGRAEPPHHSQPVRVPLQWVPDPDKAGVRKLGILAALNDGLPVLFEFDTGGTGFFATYGLGGSWWGSTPNPPTCTTNPCTGFSTTYDSGLTYSGNYVSSSVTLYGSSPAQPLLRAPQLTVGQTDAIVCNPTGNCAGKTGKAGESGWNGTTGVINPPVQGSFYGDFGMSVKPAGSSGLNSLVTQDSFWNLFDPTVVRGYRVHAASGNPWVQFGLDDDDLAPRRLRFALNNGGGISACAAPASAATGGADCGSLLVENGGTSFAGTGLTTLIFDTGATTTIHSGTTTITGVPFPPGDFPCALTAVGCPLPTDQPKSDPPDPFNATTLIDQARLRVRGLSLSTGQEETILDFLAGTTDTTTPAFNQVAVQGFSSASDDLAPACVVFNQPCSYLNTGILPFLENDVIVNLSGWSEATPAAVLSLVPQPVPAPAPLLAPVTAFGFGRRLRRRIAQRRA